MIVSIAIPKVTIILKFVIKFRVEPITLKTKKVMKNANGIESVAITDSLRLTNSNTDRKTKTNVKRPFLVTES